ncbi:NPC1, partial [Symbiodinium sp. KB8]
AFYSVIDNALDEADAMETTIDAVNKAGREAGIGEASVFAYTFVYREWEQYVVVPQEAITNVGLSIACVFVVVSLLLADLQTSILVTLVVGSCLLNILGFMHFWGVSLDGVSVVFLVLAVGLSIDYSAHIAHAFLHVHEETRKARVSKALGEMGVSVINGASSTFLAVVVLSPSASYIFSTLFRVFFLSSVLGAAHGLILLPVVLLWFGSEAHSDEAPDFEHDDEEDEEPAVAAKKPATQVELTPVAGAKSAPATVQDGKAGVAPPQQS